MTPKINSYCYGSARAAGEGLRIGVARHVPRGVPQTQWQWRGYFDLRISLLAPSAELVALYRHKKISYTVFSRRYLTQMKKPECRQAIDLLAVLALSRPISLGCFCEQECLCHRSLLRRLVDKAATNLNPKLEQYLKGNRQVEHGQYASPVCYNRES
ncbi:MAG: DUF488 family protein [Verrucomicrobiales bacterium]|jgi:uncharacterized protein YeaO (DUF488 family)|nr:DUF488 family protein [Verrucomicrobiales bacterium]